MNEVEDMLVDKNYSGTQVIDMIAFLDIIEILQNPMLDSIISNMYYGPYERELFLKKSTLYKVIEEQTNSSPGTDSIVTKSFKVFGFNHSFKTFSKYLKTKTRVFKRWKIFSSKHRYLKYWNRWRSYWRWIWRQWRKYRSCFSISSMEIRHLMLNINLI